MDICRVCLSLSPEKDINALKPTKSEEPKSSTEIFEFCLNIPVTGDPKITTKLCTKCYQKILSYYRFKILALKSDEYLRSNASNTINDTIKLKDIIAVSNSGFNDNDTGEDFNDLIFNIDNKDELQIKAECLESDGSKDEVFNLYEVKTEIEDSVLYRRGGYDTVQSETDTIDAMQTENVGEEDAPTPKVPKLDDSQPTTASTAQIPERNPSTATITSPEPKCEEHVSLNIVKNERNTHTLEVVELDNNKGKEHIAEANQLDSTKKLACSNRALRNQSVTESDNKTSTNVVKQPNCSNNNSSISTKGSVFACGICKYTTNEIESLNSHLKANACNKKYTETRSSYIHVRVHTGEKPYACNICDKKFASKWDLDKHVRIHTGEKPYSCNICDKNFTEKGNLDSHVRVVHRGEKPYSCNICVKKFTNKGNLDSHLRVHTGEKPYACNVCDKKFSVKGSLDSHVRVHTGAKPYTCNVCDQKFSGKQNLVRHLRVHTGEKPYSCNICHKKFTKKWNLDIHVRVHTGEKPYSCNACNKKYTNKGSLDSHVCVLRNSLIK